MAKAKKVHFEKDKKLRIKKKQNNKNKINFDCAVVLENIDELLRKFNISNLADRKSFNIGLRIKNNELTVRDHNISVKGQENHFHLGLRIKNDEITFNKCSEKSLAELANDAWKRCKIQNKNKSLDVDEYVLAKMKSYSPWPAKITGFTKNRKKAYVYFYGTHNSGSVEVNEIAAFQDAGEVIRMLLPRHLICFEKGVVEIERELGIPDELSITKVNAIEHC